METRSRKEADRVIEEQRLSPAQQAKKAAEFNPGMQPQNDKFGKPNEDVGRNYYPASERSEAERDAAKQARQPGETTSDRREGATADEADRTGFVRRNDDQE